MKVRALPACVLVWLLASTSSAQVTQRVSFDSSGSQGNFHSTTASISDDGRYVVFASVASNFVTGDTNGVQDVFVRDRLNGTTVRVSVATSGTEANGPSSWPSISADGRFVVFTSDADDLVSGDANGLPDIFVRDLQNGTTERVSVDSLGTEADDASDPFASISADGRYVAFSSRADNLVSGDTNGTDDVFVRDRQLGTTERASTDSGGAEGNDGSSHPVISSDGRYVAFESDATNLVSGDTNAFGDVFLRDRSNGTTELVSVDSTGVQADSDVGLGGLSSDGRYVVLDTSAANLVAADTNGATDAFVRDRASGTTERVSVATGGGEAVDGGVATSISDDGRYVAFSSSSDDLVPGDTNGCQDVFVHDRQDGTTQRANVDWAEREGNQFAGLPRMNGDGRFVAYETSADNLVLDDTNGFADIFVRDRVHVPFATLCEPGLAGAIGCPCGNPPSGPGRGCDNSAGTGGTSLSISGGEYLTSDSMVFFTNVGVPFATNILVQGKNSIPGGVIYGQGIRCLGGTVKRLFTKSSANGGIVAPDFPHGDSTIHLRSAARGDSIAAGSTRWYLVVYRDPVVLGGCPATSTFNSSQTRGVTWRP